MTELLRTNDSITDIVEKYSDTVYRLAMIQTKNKHDADDICQEVFLRLVKNLDKLENEEHLKHWLIRVTINCSRSFFKNYWNKNTEGLDENISIEDEEESEVYQSVLSLPVKYRSVIHLYYYENYSIKEIAKILNQSESAVKMRMSRARKMLKEILGEESLNV